MLYHTQKKLKLKLLNKLGLYKKKPLKTPTSKMEWAIDKRKCKFLHTKHNLKKSHFTLAISKIQAKKQQIRILLEKSIKFNKKKRKIHIKRTKRKV